MVALDPAATALDARLPRIFSVLAYERPVVVRPPAVDRVIDAVHDYAGSLDPDRTQLIESGVAAAEILVNARLNAHDREALGPVVAVGESKLEQLETELKLYRAIRETDDRLRQKSSDLRKVAGRDRVKAGAAGAFTALGGLATSAFVITGLLDIASFGFVPVLTGVATVGLDFVWRSHQKDAVKSIKESGNLESARAGLHPRRLEQGERVLEVAAQTAEASVTVGSPGGILPNKDLISKTWDRARADVNIEIALDRPDGHVEQLYTQRPVTLGRLSKISLSK